MRTILFVTFLCLSGCASLPAEDSKVALQLIAWQVSKGESCEPDAFTLDERPQRLGLGVAYWPSQRKQRPHRSQWHAYGAQANIALSAGDGHDICVSLHRRERPSGPAGRSLFAAKLSISDDQLRVHKITATQQDLASILIVRPTGDEVANGRYRWDEYGNAVDTLNSADAPISGSRVGIIVAVSEREFGYQLEPAIQQIQISTIPYVRAKPPRR